MAKAFETNPSCDNRINLQSSVRGKASRDIGEGDTQVYLDDNTFGQCDWHAVRKIAPLPVLLLDCMGDSCSSLARGLPSYPAICPVGCARVCLERLSQHQLQLDGCGASACCYGGWRMVWNEKRDDGCSGEEAPACRVAS